jgi:hypothetical protein
LPLNLTSDNAVAEEDDKPKRIVPVKKQRSKSPKTQYKNKAPEVAQTAVDLTTESVTSSQ